MPLAPGGTARPLPRMIGEKLTLRWGQPVIVENKPGGALHLGTEAVARSAPDGYTLLLAPQGPLVISPSLYREARLRSLGLRAGHDLARLPYVFVVNPKVPVSNVRGIDRLCEGQSGQAQFRHRPAPAARSISRSNGSRSLAGIRIDARALSGRGAGHDRSARRPCRS